MRNSWMMGLFLMLLLFGLPFLWGESRAEDTPFLPPAGEESVTDGDNEQSKPAIGYDSSYTIKAQIDGTVTEMDLGTYLMGVVRAEMPATFEIEALKAQAVAARTYTLYKIQNGGSANHPEADTCDDVNCCKAYLSEEEAAKNWGINAVAYGDKIREAVTATDGQVVLYDAAPILAVFHSSSAGSTNNVEDVWQRSLPYLRSVDSPETEAAVPNYYSKVTYSLTDFKNIFLGKYPEANLSGSASDWFTNIQQTEDGFVKSLSIGGVSVSGGDVRTLLGLRSASFTVSLLEDSVEFSVVGYGHGVGMSQYGANILAKEGKTYEEILTWYYTGTTVGTMP